MVETASQKISVTDINTERRALVTRHTEAGASDSWIKRCSNFNKTPNNSMDVRAKQLLCCERRLFTLACVYLVSAHVISAVRCFRVCYNGAGR